MKADMIFTSDWHLTDQLPHARCDEDYFATQMEKVNWILEQGIENECPVVVAGDVFDRPRNPEYIIYSLIEALENKKMMDSTVFLAGQHDLLQHNPDLLPYTSFGILSQVSALCFEQYYSLELNGVRLELFPWAVPLVPLCDDSIVVARRFIWKGHVEPFPGCTLEQAATELVVDPACEGNKLFVFGDNHIPFIYKERGKTVLNCGSLMRKTVQQFGHIPKIYMYYKKKGIIVPRAIPVSPDNLRIVDVEYEKEKEKKIEEYILCLQQGIEATFDFEENLKQYLHMNKVAEHIQDHVWSFVKGEKR